MSYLIIIFVLPKQCDPLNSFKSSTLLKSLEEKQSTNTDLYCV